MPVRGISPEKLKKVVHSCDVPAELFLSTYSQSRKVGLCKIADAFYASEGGGSDSTNIGIVSSNKGSSRDILDSLGGGKPAGASLIQEPAADPTTTRTLAPAFASTMDPFDDGPAGMTPTTTDRYIGGDGAIGKEGGSREPKGSERSRSSLSQNGGDLNARTHLTNIEGVRTRTSTGVSGSSCAGGGSGGRDSGSDGFGHDDERRRARENTGGGPSNSDDEQGDPGGKEKKGGEEEKDDLPEEGDEGKDGEEKKLHEADDKDEDEGEDEEHIRRVRVAQSLAIYRAQLAAERRLETANLVSVDEEKKDGQGGGNGITWSPPGSPLRLGGRGASCRGFQIRLKEASAEVSAEAATATQIVKTKGTGDHEPRCALRTRDTQVVDSGDGAWAGDGIDHAVRGGGREWSVQEDRELERLVREYEFDFDLVAARFACAVGGDDRGQGEDIVVVVSVVVDYGA